MARGVGVSDVCIYEYGLGIEFEDGRNLYYMSDRDICKVKGLFSNLPDKVGKMMEDWGALKHAKR